MTTKQKTATAMMAIVILLIWVYHIYHHWQSFTLGNLLQLGATLSLPFLFYWIVGRPDARAQFYLDQMDLIKNVILDHQANILEFQSTGEKAQVVPLFQNRLKVLLSVMHQYIVIWGLARRQNFTTADSALEILAKVVYEVSQVRMEMTDSKGEVYIKEFCRLDARRFSKILLNHHIAVCSIKGIQTPERHPEDLPDPRTVLPDDVLIIRG